MIGRSSIVISPLSGVSSPANNFMNVDLPLPENPTIARNSPSRTFRLMFVSTSVRVTPLPKPLQTSRIRSIGGGADVPVAGDCTGATAGVGGVSVVVMNYLSVS